MNVSLKRSEPDPAPDDESDETASDGGSEAGEAKRAKMEVEERINKSRLAHVNLANSLDELLDVALDAVRKHEREHEYVVLANCAETGKLLLVKDQIVKLMDLAYGMRHINEDDYVDAFKNGEENWKLGDCGVGRCGYCQASLLDGSQCMCLC